jgi:gas vesicle protein
MESGKVLLGVLGGVAVGALIGILFAPDKGTNTRKKLKDTGLGYADDLKGKFNDIKQEMTDKYGSLISEAKDAVSQQVSQAKDAVTQHVNQAKENFTQAAQKGV